MFETDLYCWFSDDVIKIQDIFYRHEVLERLKTNFHFERVPRLVIQYAEICKLLRDTTFTYGRESCHVKK